MSKIVIFLCTLLLSYGCFKEKAAQEVLRSYIEGRFRGDFDRLEVAEFLNGEMKDRVMAMSDEDFSSYSDLSSFKKKKFSVTYENCSIDKCFITYIISYDQLKESKDFFRVDSKKIAEMSKIEDSWKIEKVTNVKSYLESKDPLDIEGSSK